MSLQRNCHVLRKVELTTLGPGNTSNSVLTPRACQAVLALSPCLLWTVHNALLQQH